MQKGDLVITHNDFDNSTKTLEVERLTRTQAILTNGYRADLKSNKIIGTCLTYRKANGVEALETITYIKSLKVVRYDNSMLISCLKDIMNNEDDGVFKEYAQAYATRLLEDLEINPQSEFIAELTNGNYTILYPYVNDYVRVETPKLITRKIVEG